VRIKLLGLVTVVTAALSLMACPIDTASASLDYASTNIGTLKYVPAGTFQRDATATNTSTVSAFRMSQCEITRAQFLAIMGIDPSDTTVSSGTSDPVQNINSYQAIAFCNKLSLAEGLTPVYAVSGVDFTTLAYGSIPTDHNSDWDAATATWTATGYRLPTEMEWEWAAMGATSDRTNGYAGSGTNTTGYLKAFAGSTGTNSIGDNAWYTVNSSSKTHPVGTKAANELGLFDMSGNVSEWSWDWADAYPVGSLTNYSEDEADDFRRWRGGSWTTSASICAVAYRSFDLPGTQSSSIGFRVVRP
jgi:formylglycine-generating enzyme required for sulfatase activity